MRASEGAKGAQAPDLIDPPPPVHRYMSERVVARLALEQPVAILSARD